MRRIIYLTVLFSTILCLVLTNCRHSQPLKLLLPKEASTDFFVDSVDNILYTVNSGNSYDLCNLVTHKIIRSNLNSCFHPFLANGVPVFLSDRNGNELFEFSDESLNRLIGHRPIKQCFYSPNGAFLVVQLAKEERLILISKMLNKVLEIHAPGIFVSAIFCSAINSFALVFEEQLVMVDCKSMREENRAISLGRIKGLSVSGKYLYFSSNNQSNYHALYTLNLQRPDKEPVLLLSSDHDLLMPKKYKNDIYFLELINHEYLLERMGSDKKVKRLTDHGVIYNYDFEGNQIVYTFSDLNTPRMIYKESIPDLTPLLKVSKADKVILQCSSFSYERFIQPAFLISHAGQTVPKGIVVYLHPGKETDYSPRWDTYLSNLVINGYFVVAPNLPGSFGAGRKYLNANTDDALEGLDKLDEYISKRFKLPIFYVASSSSNILLEHFLEKKERSQIHGAVSLFGLSDGSSDLNSFSIPIVYHLGENDPYVNYQTRLKELPSVFQNPNFKVVSYADEGHWCRKNQNLKIMIYNTMDFFTNH